MDPRRKSNYDLEKNTSFQTESMDKLKQVNTIKLWEVKDNKIVRKDVISNSSDSQKSN